MGSWYTPFTSCHPPGVKRGFLKGEALRLLRTNSSETMFEHNLSKFILRLIKRGQPKKFVRRTLSEVNFATRQSALLQKNKTFVTTYQPSVRHLNKNLMLNWDLIQNQPLLNTIFRNPPIAQEPNYERYILSHHIYHVGSPCRPVFSLFCEFYLEHLMKYVIC